MKRTDSAAAFNEAYASLNAAQRQAVDAIEGPVMVIAGPGTGKTQILTLRIANILRQTDARPEHILALTFTEAGARAMRARLRTLIGPAAYQVRIQTFHGFADSLITAYPDAYPAIIGGQAMSDLGRIELVTNILEDPQYRALRPAGKPDYYVRPILQAIQTLKQEYIAPDDFAVHVATLEQQLETLPRYHETGAHKGKERSDYRTAATRLAKNQELATLYRSYVAGLRAQHRYDFEDMILETISALTRDEGMLRDLQETYQYILADEHQDVNGSQNQLLALLTNFHARPNLFVVGDEKQAIYRFQGASLENFLYFETQFGSTTTITLTDNYRSGQPVLDVAQGLVATDDPTLAPLRQPLTAVAVEVADVSLRSFAHQVVEDAWVVSDVEAQLAAGVPPNEIAVIVRSNREVEGFAAALRAAGIAVAPTADGDILHHPLLVHILELLTAVCRPADQVALTRVLHAPYWQLDPADLWRVLGAVRRQTPLAAVLADTALLTAAGVQTIDAVQQIVVVLEGLRASSLTRRPVELIELALTESGLLEYAVAQDPYAGVRVIRRLYDTVEAMETTGEARTVTEVVARLELHRAHGISISAPFVTTSDEAVVVTTAHKSKGLEFTVVYVPHLTDRQWGGRVTKPTFDLPLTKHVTLTDEIVLDDERRLLYVALTRAKTTLRLSYADTTAEGSGAVPSRFLVDLEATSVLKRHDTNEFAATCSLANTLRPAPVRIPDAAFLRHVLTTRGLSPTALNNYLKSPWEYLYRNALQVPQVKTPELEFGTCVHSVLEQLQRHAAAGGPLSPTLVADTLTQVLSRTTLTDEAYTRLHERGLAALVGYLPTLSADDLATSRTEMALTASLPTGLPELPELTLTGNLDRVDYQDGRVIRVVDYKTGKPKTRGQIEGTVKGGLGEYKRQLTFYALLLELQADPALACRETVLSFVEPDQRGEYRDACYHITDEEIAALKNELITVAGDLLSGAALAVPCDPERCHYCDLVAQWMH
jgi:DNA helicase-2/ATP-dependent DNA helicase PcrA